MELALVVILFACFRSKHTRDTISSVANFIGGDAWYNVSEANDTQYFSDIDYGSKVTAGVDLEQKLRLIENLEKLTLMLQSKVFIYKIDNKNFKY